MNLFIDTEFTTLTHSSAVALVSIALVGEHPQHYFYAELTDTYTPLDCSSFVSQHILPHLGHEPVAHLAPVGLSISAAMSMAVAEQSLRAWLGLLYRSQPLPHHQARTPLQIWSLSPPHDWYWISRIFKGHIPEVLEQQARPIHACSGEQQQQADQLRAQAWRSKGFRKHHALEDARLLARIWSATHAHVESVESDLAFE